MNNYLQNQSEQNNLEDRIYNLEQNLERTNRLILDIKNDLDSLKIQSTNSHQTFNNTLNLLLSSMQKPTQSISRIQKVSNNDNSSDSSDSSDSSSSSDNNSRNKSRNNSINKGRNNNSRNNRNTNIQKKNKKIHRRTAL
tara:strand:+ start:996 stop:1412 length:417 start_codon:yes stop_codon:yes gene_type:complete